MSVPPINIDQQTQFLAVPPINIDQQGENVDQLIMLQGKNNV
jgi:hypothetical protein